MRSDRLLHAVDGVSFTIGRGETVGLVGESGCGKSTLVRLLARLIDPTDGTIRFDGDRYRRGAGIALCRAIPRRAQIQMVFQDADRSASTRASPRSDAIADPLLRLARLSRAALRARVEELARLCGLPRELLTRFPHQLSGGQKARVGIARAIAVEPRPADPRRADLGARRLGAGRDPATARRAEARSSTCRYLFVSHDLNVVRLLCDRILVMYLGQIVESGPADEVFAAPGASLHAGAAVGDAASPVAHAGERTRIGLPGEPRSPIDPDPNVCRFYGRCPRASRSVPTAMPELRELAPGRESPAISRRRCCEDARLARFRIEHGFEPSAMPTERLMRLGAADWVDDAHGQGDRPCRSDRATRRAPRCIAQPHDRAHHRAGRRWRWSPLPDDAEPAPVFQP